MKNSVKTLRNVILGTQCGTRAAILAVSIIFSGLQGGAQQNQNLVPGKSITERITEFAQQQLQMEGNKLPFIVMSLTTIINDERMDELNRTNIEEPYYNIDKPKFEVMDVLARREGKYPVVTGAVGSGKSAVINALFDDILSRKFPSDVHRKELENKVGFRVSARSLHYQFGVLDLKGYIDTVKLISKNLNIDPIIVIEEASFVDEKSLSILVQNAPFLKDGVPVIIEADNKSYSTAVKQYPQFERYEQKVSVPETQAKDLPILLDNSGYTDMLESRYKVRLSNEVIEAAVEVAPDYRLDLAEPARTMQLLEAVAIRTARESGNEELTKKDIYSYVAETAGIPVVPQDRESFAEFMDGLRERVLAKVIGQDHIVNGIVDQFQEALTSNGKKHTSAMVMGPTGVGKTYGAEVIAEEYFGSKEKVLKLDMTQFMDENQANVLFGAPNGYVSAKENKGQICEFLDGVAKGGGVIIMDEFEEAHSSIVTRMMEMFDQGYIRGGDGKVRYLGRSLIVMTSNKQSDKILPPSRIKGMTTAELNRVVSNISQEQLKKAWTEKASFTEGESSQVKDAVMERVDHFYYAKPLLADEAIQVTQLEIAKYVKEKASTDDIDLKVDESFATTLTNAFYNEKNGARQLKTMVRNSLSSAINAFRKEHGQQAQDFEVSAKLHPSKQTESYITIKEVGTDDELTIDGPKVPVKNKLLDADFRDRLENLEENIKSEVFGQDEAINSILGAVNSRYLKANKAKAMAGFLIGTTGTGKTQLGKTTAKYLFGREDAFESFDMGKITDVDKMGDIFPPPKPYIGSDKTGAFEEFLNKFPDGGVIIFDEMSNAGGNDFAKKNAIAKTFYKPLDEGVYTNPSGKTYDLSNYLILFTGNDGEKAFQGLSSDSMIEETYKALSKDQAKVNQILLDAGVPDAFLGRLGFVTLMRPALSHIRRLIAKKMLDEWVYDIESVQPFNIHYTDELVDELADLLFTPAEGARSIVKFLDEYMGRAVGGAIKEYDWEVLLENGLKGDIYLSFNVDKAKSQFYPDKPYENKASILLEAKLNGTMVTQDELDFSLAANFKPQNHLQDATDTAYHEMGHAVTSYPEVTGKELIKINIVPEKVGSLSTAGYAQYDEKPVAGKQTRTWLVHHIAGLLGGSEAEAMISGRERNGGRSNDVERAGTTLVKLVLDHHMLPELDTAHAYADEKGIVHNLPPKEKRIFDNYIRKVMKDARKLARKTVKENEHIVKAGAELLLKVGDISGETYKILVERGQEAVEKAGYKKRQAVKLGLLSAADAYPISIDDLIGESCNDLLQ